MSQLVNRIKNNTLVSGTKRIQSSIVIRKREENSSGEIIQKESKNKRKKRRKRKKRKRKKSRLVGEEGLSLEALELCLWNIFSRKRRKEIFFLH